MEFQNRSLTCSDCSSTFIFGAQEQEQFAAKGYTNVPGRCPSCRQARRAKREDEARSASGTRSYSDTHSTSRYSGGGYGNDSFRSAPRQMYPAKCATCGKDTQVPFQPRGDRPVYCPDCYRKTAAAKRR